jgi:hypothetical protein
MGGLTARPLGAPPFFAVIAQNVTWPTQTADFTANSPTIVAARGCRYENLVFQTYNVSGGNLRIQVRDADTGVLLPDSEVPGNSSGIISAAAVRQTVHTAQFTSPPKVLSLAGVATGRHIYIDVWGHAAQSDYRNQPRLAGLWVSFAQTGETVGTPSTVINRSGGTWRELKIR